MRSVGAGPMVAAGMPGSIGNMGAVVPADGSDIGRLRSSQPFPRADLSTITAGLFAEDATVITTLREELSEAKVAVGTWRERETAALVRCNAFEKELSRYRCAAAELDGLRPQCAALQVSHTELRSELSEMQEQAAQVVARETAALDAAKEATMEHRFQKGCMEARIEAITLQAEIECRRRICEIEEEVRAAQARAKSLEDDVSRSNMYLRVIKRKSANDRLAWIGRYAIKTQVLRALTAFHRWADSTMRFKQQNLQQNRADELSRCHQDFAARERQFLEQQRDLLDKIDARRYSMDRLPHVCDKLHHLLCLGQLLHIWAHVAVSESRVREGSVYAVHVGLSRQASSVCAGKVLDLNDKDASRAQAAAAFKSWRLLLQEAASRKSAIARRGCFLDKLSTMFNGFQEGTVRHMSGLAWRSWRELAQRRRHRRRTLGAMHQVDIILETSKALQLLGNSFRAWKHGNSQTLALRNIRVRHCDGANRMYTSWHTSIHEQLAQHVLSCWRHQAEQAKMLSSREECMANLIRRQEQFDKLGHHFMQDGGSAVAANCFAAWAHLYTQQVVEMQSRQFRYRNYETCAEFIHGQDLDCLMELVRSAVAAFKQNASRRKQRRLCSRLITSWHYTLVESLVRDVFYGWQHIVEFTQLDIENQICDANLQECREYKHGLALLLLKRSNKSMVAAMLFAWSRFSKCERVERDALTVASNLQEQFRNLYLPAVAVLCLRLAIHKDALALQCCLSAWRRLTPSACEGLANAREQLRISEERCVLITDSSVMLWADSDDALGLHMLFHRWSHAVHVEVWRRVRQRGYSTISSLLTKWNTESLSFLQLHAFCLWCAEALGGARSSAGAQAWQLRVAQAVLLEARLGAESQLLHQCLVAWCQLDECYRKRLSKSAVKAVSMDLLDKYSEVLALSLHYSEAGQLQLLVEAIVSRWRGRVLRGHISASLSRCRSKFGEIAERFVLNSYCQQGKDATLWCLHQWATKVLQYRDARRSAEYLRRSMILDNFAAGWSRLRGAVLQQALFHHWQLQVNTTQDLRNCRQEMERRSTLQMSLSFSRWYASLLSERETRNSSQLSHAGERSRALVVNLDRDFAKRLDREIAQDMLLLWHKAVHKQIRCQRLKKVSMLVSKLESEYIALSLQAAMRCWTEAVTASHDLERLALQQEMEANLVTHHELVMSGALRAWKKESTCTMMRTVLLSWAELVGQGTRARRQSLQHMVQSLKNQRELLSLTQETRRLHHMCESLTHIVLVSWHLHRSAVSSLARQSSLSSHIGHRHDVYKSRVNSLCESVNTVARGLFMANVLCEWATHAKRIKFFAQTHDRWLGRSAIYGLVGNSVRRQSSAKRNSMINAWSGICGNLQRQVLFEWWAEYVLKRRAHKHQLLAGSVCTRLSNYEDWLYVYITLGIWQNFCEIARTNQVAAGWCKRRNNLVMGIVFCTNRADAEHMALAMLTLWREEFRQTKSDQFRQRGREGVCRAFAWKSEMSDALFLRLFLHLWSRGQQICQVLRECRATNCAHRERHLLAQEMVYITNMLRAAMQGWLAQANDLSLRKQHRDLLCSSLTGLAGTCSAAVCLSLLTSWRLHAKHCIDSRRCAHRRNVLFEGALYQIVILEVAELSSIVFHVWTMLLAKHRSERLTKTAEAKELTLERRRRQQLDGTSAIRERERVLEYVFEALRAIAAESREQRQAAKSQQVLAATVRKYKQMYTREACRETELAVSGLVSLACAWMLWQFPRLRNRAAMRMRYRDLAHVRLPRAEEIWARKNLISNFEYVFTLWQLSYLEGKAENLQVEVTFQKGSFGFYEMFRESQCQTCFILWQCYAGQAKQKRRVVNIQFLQKCFFWWHISINELQMEEVLHDLALLTAQHDQLRAKHKMDVAYLAPKAEEVLLFAIMGLCLQMWKLTTAKSNIFNAQQRCSAMIDCAVALWVASDLTNVVESAIVAWHGVVREARYENAQLMSTAISREATAVIRHRRTATIELDKARTESERKLAVLSGILSQWRNDTLLAQRSRLAAILLARADGIKQKMIAGRHSFTARFHDVCKDLDSYVVFAQWRERISCLRARRTVHTRFSGGCCRLQDKQVKLKIEWRAVRAWHRHYQELKFSRRQSAALRAHRSVRFRQISHCLIGVNLHAESCLLRLCHQTWCWQTQRSKDQSRLEERFEEQTKAQRKLERHREKQRCVNALKRTTTHFMRAACVFWHEAGTKQRMERLVAEHAKSMLKAKRHLRSEMDNLSRYLGRMAVSSILSHVLRVWSCAAFSVKIQAVAEKDKACLQAAVEQEKACLQEQHAALKEAQAAQSADAMQHLQEEHSALQSELARCQQRQSEHFALREAELSDWREKIELWAQRLQQKHEVSVGFLVAVFDHEVDAAVEYRFFCMWHQLVLYECQGALQEQLQAQKEQLIDQEKQLVTMKETAGVSSQLVSTTEYQAEWLSSELAKNREVTRELELKLQESVAQILDLRRASANAATVDIQKVALHSLFMRLITVVYGDIHAALKDIRVGEGDSVDKAGFQTLAHRIGLLDSAADVVWDLLCASKGRETLTLSELGEGPPSVLGGAVNYQGAAPVSAIQDAVAGVLDVLEDGQSSGCSLLSSADTDRALE